MTNPSQDRCSNCNIPIGALEQPYLWKDHIVCAACYQRLSAAPVTPGAPIPPSSIPAVTYATPPQDSAISTIIPYRNGWALASYYLGIFSLFPCLGGIMGILAVIFGIKGLRLAKANPTAKGKVHAIVGIVCGGIFGVAWILVIVLWFVMMFMAVRTRAV